MSGAKPIAFGKRGRPPTQPSPPLPLPVRRGLVWGLAGATAVMLAAGALAVYFSQTSIGESATTADNLVAAAQSPFNGVWAASGEACDVARMKIELDGTTLTSISILGRLPVGTYTLAGSNPVTLSFPNGDTVVWDATSKNELIPISVSPEKGPRRLKMMHLTRC